VVSITGAAALTSTVVAAEPTSSTISLVAGADLKYQSSRLKVLNPLADTMIV